MKRIAIVIGMLGAATASSSAGAASSDTLARNKALAIRFNTDFFGGKNFDEGVALMSENFVEHHPTDAEPERTKAQLVAKFRKMMAGRPAGGGGAPTDPVMTVAEGDKVLLVFKQNRPYPKDPTRTYEAFSFELYRLAGGKVAEHWDTATIGSGGMPPMPPAP